MHHMPRLAIQKTYKLFIDGKFPRTESGRSMPASTPTGDTAAHMCQSSRKDLRNAIVAARKALPRWAGRDAYNRGQILYRMAEMLEGKHTELTDALLATGAAADRKGAKAEVDASIDRIVAYAGWADKFHAVLGSNNPVVGPYYNFTVPTPTGVTVAVAPDEPALLGLITLIAPALCAGCSVVALGSTAHPIATAVLGEVCATSDVPPGVVNLLTGHRDELIPHIASHRDVDAVTATGLESDETRALRLGATENIKRVRIFEEPDTGYQDHDACATPWWIEPFIEMKTIWHPSSAG